MTKRPLFVVAVFLVLGEFLAAWNGKMAFGWIAGICVPAVFFYYRRGKRIRQKMAGVTLLLAGWAGCFLYLRADAPDAMRLYCEQAGEPGTVWAEGYAEQMEETEYGVRIRLKGADVRLGEICWEDQGIIVNVPSAFGLKIGNRIGVEGTLKQFTEASNPGEFDLRKYYRAQGYGYTMTCDELVLLDGRYDHVREFLNRLRQKMKNNIYALSDEKDAGILCAVFLGDSDAAGEEIRELYERQGIAHLLSVSGLHISMIGMLIYRVLRRWSGSYGAAGVLGGGMVILYGMMTGGSLSATRAVIMYLVSLLGAWRGRIYDMQTSLAVSALAIACTSPLVVVQSSFQLSFSAVLGLGMVTDIWKAFLLREDRQGMLSVFGLHSMMLPALLFSFYKQPLFSILLNQLVLPFGGLLIACAAGCACFGGMLSPIGRMMAAAGGGILSYYEILCQAFGRIPGGILVNGRPEVWRIAVYLLFLAGLAVTASAYRERKKRILSCEMAPEHWKKRFYLVHLGAIAVTCFAVVFLKADPVRKLEITMLDVGQGDCFLIRLPGGIDILSDCGSSSEKELAEYIVEPALLSMGIESLDTVILSHADEDHAGGLVGLLERGNIRVEQVLLPDYTGCREDFANVIRAVSFSGSACALWTKGTVLEAGEAKLVCLHPFSDRIYEDTNSASLVFGLTYKEFDMVFTGDIGSREEAEIRAGDADVLKAAHHGSKYSSSAAWLEQVSAAAVLISCGKDNRYGHPHKEALERFEAAGADYYITAETGAVLLTSDGEQFEIRIFDS